MSDRSNAFWIKLDESDDVAGSVRHCIAAVDLTRQDHAAWKWVILSLHSALQGACVCHLSTTAHPIGALTKQNTAEWLEYFDLRHDDLTVACPKTILAPLPELLKRIRKIDSAGDNGQGSRIALSDSELSWLSRLNDDVRNQFVHFAPMGWSLDVSGMAGLIALTGRLIREISSYGWAFRHEDDEWRAMLSDDLGTLERVSAQLFSDIATQPDAIV